MTEQKQKQRFSTRARFALVAFIILLLIGSFVGFRLYQEEQFVVDGTIPRAPVQSGSSPSQIEHFEDWIAGYEIEAAPEAMTLSAVNPVAPVYQEVEAVSEGKEPIHFTGGKWCDVPGGQRFRIIKIGAYHGKPNEKGQYSFHEEMTISTDQFTSQDSRYLQTNLSSYQPQIGLLYESPATMNYLLKKKSIRDQLNGYRYSSSGSSSSFQSIDDLKMKAARYDSQIFHQGGLEIVHDLYCGEKIVQKLPLENKSVFTVGNTQVAMVVALPIKKTNSSSGINWNGDLQFNTTRYDPDGEQTCVALLSQSSLAMWVRLLLTDGRIVNHNMSSVSSGPSMASHYFYCFDAPFDQIENVLVESWPRHETVIYTMDKIPGLPDKRQKNLMKTRIEYLKVTSSYEFGESLNNALQLRSLISTQPTFPPGYFPKTFENITVEELFREYLNHIPNHGTPVFDEEKGTMRIPREEKGWIDSVLEKTF